jgi:hypothetical protein
LTCHHTIAILCLCIDLNGKTAHYVIVRKDITPGQQAAQILHAAGESAIPKPEPGCIAVALHAENEDHLLELEAKLYAAQIPYESVVEEDGHLMAIGLHPTTDRDKIRKVLSSLPLVK